MGTSLARMADDPDKPIGEWLNEWEREGARRGDQRHFLGNCTATYIGHFPVPEKKSPGEYLAQEVEQYLAQEGKPSDD